LGGTDPVTPDTLMMIGSTTKSFTTLLMAILVDEGVITWDTPVVDILPSFALQDPEVTQQITVRNLVCACSGVPRRDLEWVFNSNTAEGIIESLAEYALFTDFGEAFQYSNQLVASGGYIAALAAGGEYGDLAQAYLDVMQARVFDPLGMTDTTFSFDTVAASDNYALPHGATLLGEYVASPLTLEAVLTQVAPAGSLWSNANDMARYLITQLNRGVTPEGERIVSAENLELTWEPQVSVSADMQYGLGWLVEDYDGLQLIHHGGNTFGFTSDLAFLPEVGVGIVVLTNARGSNLFNEAVRERFFELLFDQESDMQATIDFALKSGEEALAEIQAQLQPSLDKEVITPYLGTFSNDLLGDITLSLDGERLIMDAGEFTSELRAGIDDEGETYYILIDPPLAGIPLDLVESEAGVPTIQIDIVTDVYTFTRP
ncbi:MAG: beta-lactamase family protein, partial [Armatimonadetes bacterium]|nr:beta-lactamase family protein [Anaerolineae bacterium]